MIYGISGITDRNLREGLNVATKIFDKSYTQMDEKDYLNYCRIGDIRQTIHIIDEGKRVITKPAERTGIDMVIEDTGIVLHSEDFEPLLHAMSYPLHYQELDRNLRALLMVFEIGNHRVRGVKYVYDGTIRSRSDKKWPYICSDNHHNDQFGYHLEPGVVKVHKILEIHEEKKGHPELCNAMKPFRLIDGGKGFSL